MSHPNTAQTSAGDLTEDSAQPSAQRLLQKLASGVAVFFFATLFLTFLVQISARFLFKQPLTWTDELAVILYIWCVLWCAAFVVPESEHVRFDLLHEHAAAPVRRFMRALGCLVLAALALLALRGNADYIWFMRRESTPVLGLSFFWVFLPFGLLLLSLILRFGYGTLQAWRAKAIAS